MQVTVLPADGTIVVNGIAIRGVFDTPAGVQSIHWAGDHGVGQITGGTAHGPFRDPSVIAPYVAAWRTGMQRCLAATESAEAIERAAYEAHVADEQRRDAERRERAQADAAAEEAAKQAAAS